ncbi:hypothetical protein I4U23_027643 [Adineta vaga]|nr:hypothetical protein I4U23_027643 [Adineta vaga]
MIKTNCNLLRPEFIQIDSHKTGFIQSEEFDDILTDLDLFKQIFKIQMIQERSTIDDVSIKIRRKLSHSYKQVRRSFKEISNEHKCSLNDEEFYILISQLDTKMNG